jgi:ferredoxin-type protein NapH|tara:strand:+ start:8466 stop:10085 length:1620 start_codon:yes stop_codon:yes gene_type:complete
MKGIKNTGLVIFLAAFTLFNAVSFMGDFEVTEVQFEKFLADKWIKSEFVAEEGKKKVVGKWASHFELSAALLTVVEASHDYHRAIIKSLEESGSSKEKVDTEWGKVLWIKDTKKHAQYAYPLIRNSATGFVAENKGTLFWLTFGLGIFGGLLFLLPAIKIDGTAGIKNDGIFQNQATNKGWIAWLVFGYLVTFYIVLYFMPDFAVNQILLVDNVSLSLSGNPAGEWFLYGFMYCVFMTVMGIRMLIKYRYNKYQIIRTISVLFFQIAFAFLIPEILVRFKLPWYDFKNAWPLDYDFFFDWNFKALKDAGSIGLFMLVWGIVLTLIVVPVMVYFFGKRWYCSWVCGCGGLAETAGDPYRQHSDKSMKAWKFERIIIYSVFVFAIFMTIGALTRAEYFLGMKAEDIRFWYGFAVGSIFSGVIGTGFYPIFGNRVWCRFGCPLAAYMGIVQRFKSRFRITTNGGQCISCGNCSTYCEQGIDVRAYAQKGQNIVRSSCVGCGICSAVCLRGVLKLENGPEEKRISDDNPIVIGNDGVKLKDMS